MAKMRVKVRMGRLFLNACVLNFNDECSLPIEKLNR